MSKKSWLGNVLGSLSTQEKDEIRAQLDGEDEQTIELKAAGNEGLVKELEALKAELEQSRAESSEIKELLRQSLAKNAANEDNEITKAVDGMIEGKLIAPSAKEDLTAFLSEIAQSETQINGKSLIDTFQGFFAKGGAVDSAKAAFEDDKVSPEAALGNLGVTSNLFGGDGAEMSNEDISALAKKVVGG